MSGLCVCMICMCVMCVYMGCVCVMCVFEFTYVCHVMIRMYACYVCMYVLRVGYECMLRTLRATRASYVCIYVICECYVCMYVTSVYSVCMLCMYVRVHVMLR